MSAEAPKESPTGGTKIMNLQGRLASERERLSGMTSEERLWRKKWLADQVLSPREPVYISALDKELMNPIRRFYRKPLDVLFHRLLQPRIGFEAATTFRFYTGRILMGIWGIYIGFYYFKYHIRDWTHQSGWRKIVSRPAVYPGDAGYPDVSKKSEGYQFVDHGFKDSIFGKKFPHLQEK